MAAEAATQNQRKRTLAALEQRFAIADAELLQQNPQSQTQVAASASPSFNHSLKKGDVSLTSHNALSESDANNPAYSLLSHPVHDNLLNTDDKISGGGITVNIILNELLQKGDFAQKYAQGSKGLRTDNWILLDNLVQARRASSGTSMRALLRQSKASKKCISMKQQKSAGCLNVPQGLLKYDVFKPMHEMWKDYMSQLLRNTGKNQLPQCILNADLHGANILVVHSKVSLYSGVSGIMIRETAETFGIIAEDNNFRVVPKKISIFVFQVDCWKVTLRGDKLSMRNSWSK